MTNYYKDVCKYTLLDIQNMIAEKTKKTTSEWKGEN